VSKLDIAPASGFAPRSIWTPISPASAMTARASRRWRAARHPPEAPRRHRLREHRRAAGQARSAWIPADIDAKLITAGRGGYCYEQNGLLKRVLTALGFEVTGLMARVLWMVPDDAPPRPRSHMVLGVRVDRRDTWLADVGFGGCVLTAPLRLFSDEVQDTPNGEFRILPIDELGGERRVQANLSGRWAATYQVALGAWADQDYEQANFYTYAHPARTSPGA
jgi:arylamine N-acetyltransferase